MTMVVMMGVAPWHLQYGHVEIVVVIFLELQYVLPFLHVEYGNDCVSRASLRVLDSLLSLGMMVSLVVVLIFFCMVVLSVIAIPIFMLVMTECGALKRPIG